MRGIILAGGTGSRLHPITLGISKQLVPVYDKPMIYYPLSTLMLAGIRDVLVITTPHEAEGFRRLLGDGVAVRDLDHLCRAALPDGLAQAFTIGADFIGDDSSALVLGDNIFYGHGFGRTALPAQRHRRRRRLRLPGRRPHARTASWSSTTPARRFRWRRSRRTPAATSPCRASISTTTTWSASARDLKPSARGEYEITDLNRTYLEQGRLHVEVLERGTAWLDTGTFESLIDACNFIRTVESRQGLKIGAPEEVAWRQGFLTDDELRDRAQRLTKSGYGRYLLDLLDSADAQDLV